MNWFILIFVLIFLIVTLSLWISVYELRKIKYDKDVLTKKLKDCEQYSMEKYQESRLWKLRVDEATKVLNFIEYKGENPDV